MMLFKILIIPERLNENTKEQIMSFCEKDVRVTCVIRQLGDIPYEIEVEVENYDAFQKFTDDFRQQVGDFVKNMEVVILRHDWLHRMPLLKVK